MLTSRPWRKLAQELTRRGHRVSAETGEVVKVGSGTKTRHVHRRQPGAED